MTISLEQRSSSFPSEVDFSNMIEDSAYMFGEPSSMSGYSCKPGPITCKGCKPLPQPGCRPPCKGISSGNYK